MAKLGDWIDAHPRGIHMPGADARVDPARPVAYGEAPRLGEIDVRFIPAGRQIRARALELAGFGDEDDRGGYLAFA